jgi:hypothetical protein
LDKLLFIEDKSSKGFCSEACIEDFYYPLMRHFENLETALRAKLHLERESIDFEVKELAIVDQVLSSPSERWSNKNDLGEEIFTYIKHFKDFTSIVICTVYKGEGSFVFLNTKTKSPEFLGALRGSSVEAINQQSVIEQDTGQNLELNEDDYHFIQLLESKKSKLLADLLEKRKDSDISFEEFNDYEYCFQECLETPDEVFESRDNEGDFFYVYSKSFLKSTPSQSLNFFYIIACLKKGHTENVFPVLAFPTNDIEIYSHWRSGKKISGMIKN